MIINSWPTWSKVGTSLAVSSPGFPNSTTAADLLGDVPEDGEGAGWRSLTETQNTEALTLFFWYHRVGCRGHMAKQQKKWERRDTACLKLSGNFKAWHAQPVTCCPLRAAQPMRQCSMLWHHSHSLFNQDIKMKQQKDKKQTDGLKYTGVYSNLSQEEIHSIKCQLNHSLLWPRHRENYGICTWLQHGLS